MLLAISVWARRLRWKVWRKVMDINKEWYEIFMADVQKERERQVLELGYTLNHDTEHGVEKLLKLTLEYLSQPASTVEAGALIQAALDVIAYEKGEKITIPIPVVAPLGIPVETKEEVYAVWDAFVKPEQDVGIPQSVEMRILMAILRAVYKGYGDRDRKPADTSGITSGDKKVPPGKRVFDGDGEDGWPNG
jgi:hypothetical protein